MTIAIRTLQSLDDLRAAVTLQQTVLGDRSSQIWQLPQLHHVQQTGGVLLAAFKTDHGTSAALHGILIDLIAEVDGYPARRTIAWGVDPKLRNRGIGLRLRRHERRCLQRIGIDLVYWDVDPLDSVQLYVALNKLGGIVTAYSSNVLGSLSDVRTPGLAVDHVRVEWWIDSPRVADWMKRGLSLPHQQIGLHTMDVVTKTTLLSTGVRGLIDCQQHIDSDHVLVEIPENSADLVARDREAAIGWRLRTRDLMNQLFRDGYLGVGLIHQGGRSFLLFKKTTRRMELQATIER